MPQPIDLRMNSPLMGPLETVTVLHHPITWPVYLLCAVAHRQAHTARSRLHRGSNIVSYPFHSKSIDPPIFLRYGYLNIQP